MVGIPAWKHDGRCLPLWPQMAVRASSHTSSGQSQTVRKGGGQMAFSPYRSLLSSEEDPQKTLHTVPYVALMRTGAQALSPPLWAKGNEMPATWSVPDSSSGLGTAQVKGAQLEVAPVSYAALPSPLNPPAILPGGATIFTLGMRKWAQRGQATCLRAHSHSKKQQRQDFN